MRKLTLSCLLCCCLILVGCSASKQGSNSESTSVSAPAGVSIFPNINRIQISWTANSFAESFKIYRSVAGENDFILIGTSTNSGFSDAVFLYNTTYEYSISAVYSGGAESGLSNPVFGSIINQVAPSSPSGLSVVETEENITVRWTASDDEDLDFYDIYRSLLESSGFEQINDVPVHKTFSEYADNNVIEDITYYYRIKSTDVAGNESNFSDFVTGNRIDRVPPSQPSFLDFELDTTAVTVTVNWDLNTDLDIVEYRIYRATLEDTIPILIATADSDTDTYLDDNVEQNIYYDYYISAYDDDGNESALSDRTRIIIDDIVAPEMPENFTATFDSSSITLSWDDSSADDLAGYQIYRSSSEDGTYTRQNINTLTESSYIDTDVERTGTYYYKVLAQDTDANFSVTTSALEVAYFPEIDSYTVQDRLSVVLHRYDDGIIETTHNYTVEYIDHFSGESGVTRTTLTSISDSETTIQYIYTKKVSGITYIYFDSSPFIGAEGNSEALEFVEVIQDGAKAGYTNDFYTIDSFEEITGPDNTSFYVAKALIHSDSEEVSYTYIGETFFNFGGYEGADESSPDILTELTSYEE